MFAFSGSHRSGKTTLARIVAERLGVPFIDSSVTAELAALGMNQVDDLGPQDRIAVQRKRLELHMEKLLAAPRPAISDRSPLDIAAYALGEFGMHCDPACAEEARKIVEECVRLTALHYDTIILVPPLPVYAVEEGKPPMNAGYQWHIHYLIAGVLDECPHICKGRLPTSNLDDRVENSVKVFSSRLAEMSAWAGEMRLAIH